MSRQLFAKVGVFALIVLNLGAYYVFWPDSGSHGNGADKSDNPGKSMPPAATASAAQPGDSWKPVVPDPVPLPNANPLPTPKLADAAPKTTGEKPLLPPVRDVSTPSVPSPGADNSAPGGAITIPALPEPVGFVGQSPPTPADPPARPDDPTKVQLQRLMDTFKKEEPAKPAATPPTPPGDPLAGKLPQAPPLPGPPTAKVASRAVQNDNSPWSLHWEITDGRTSLTARLNKRLEFRIIGDRVKIETPDGAVVAIGKVTFTGPNLRGSCERLTIGLAGDIIALEGKAELQIQQGNLSDLAIPTVDLRGEQFTLRLQQLTGGVTQAQGIQTPTAPSGIIPASVNPLNPSPFTLPGNPTKK